MREFLINICKAVCVIILMMAQFSIAKPVPPAANLTISFKFKDNNNMLSGKQGPGYKILEDAYKETIWIEGPYNSDRTCQIIDFERQDIKLTKVITFWAEGAPGARNAPNGWNYIDYDTPNFVAALVVGNIFPYCMPGEVFMAGCTNSPLAPVNAQRQDPETGGMWCDSNSYICLGETLEGGEWYTRMRGDLTQIPDGISGVTVHPALDPEPVVRTWNMKDNAGNLIEEGYYLVWVQLSAHRIPSELDGFGDIVNGIDVKGMETCWDNVYYDTLGHHRVVKLFNFKDSAFMVADTNEKQYNEDPYQYLDGPITFTYSTTESSIGWNNSKSNSQNSKLKIFPNPSQGGQWINFELIEIPKFQKRFKLEIFNIKGQLVQSVNLNKFGKAKIKLNHSSKVKLNSGVYLVKIDLGHWSIQQKIFIQD